MFKGQYLKYQLVGGGRPKATLGKPTQNAGTAPERNRLLLLNCKSSPELALFMPTTNWSNFYSTASL